MTELKEMPPSARYVPLYERDDLRAVTGDALHPGGLELTQRLLARCELPPKARILDIGCGNGASLSWLKTQKKLSSMGVDVSRLLLQEAAQHGLEVVSSPASRLPFPEASFDAVLMECSLSVVMVEENFRSAHWALQELSALNEVRRVLQPEGLLLVSDLYARRPEGIAGLRALPAESCLRGVLDLREVQAALPELGFELLCCEDCSDALGSLGNRLCRAYGSMPAFLNQGLGSPIDAMDLTIRIGRAKPGYFILIAQKMTGRTAAGIDSSEKQEN